MNVTFRADSSHRLGFGHLGRCRNLATELVRLGYACRFVRSGPRDEVLDELNVVWLDIEDDEVGGRRDADMTLRAARGAAVGPPIIVVDHYRIDRSWESVVRDEGALVVAIDDLADRPHDCHVLIDASPLPLDRYEGLVSADTNCLLGLDYALLDPDASNERSPALGSEGHAKRVLVCFGGGDNRMLIEMMLEACSDPRLSELAFDIVTADDQLAECLNAARAIADVPPSSETRVRIWGWIPDLRGLLRSCDISVGAGGGLAMERVRLGIPSVVVTLSENQVPTSRALSRLGLLRHVGNPEDCSAQLLADEVHALALDTEALSIVKRNGPALLDGYGASRCAREVHHAHTRLASSQ